VRKKRAHGEQEWTYDTPMREMPFHLLLILTFFHGSQLPPFILLYLHLGSRTYKFMIAELRDLLKLQLQQELTKLGSWIYRQEKPADAMPFVVW
jgi:hypothetical protein